MKIFGPFGKKNVSEDLTKKSPYRIMTEWMPYKLYSGKKSTSSLTIKLKNMTGEALLTSVVAEVPKQLGFDEIGLTKQKEVRLGYLAPEEEKEVRIDVYNSSGADPGDYTVSLTAIAHYRDYGHILNAIRKRAMISVV
ncbi:MAG: hypothetical protein M1500_03910 [Candidatus Marsarchaeota archaeon]|nr:hypothetical protein [Candidatus Marsarchaeota archaeon]MCL5112820.1 hypothetical protein [Candidatus Marsarchaeota archaeon]